MMAKPVNAESTVEERVTSLESSVKSIKDTLTVVRSEQTSLWQELSRIKNSLTTVSNQMTEMGDLMEGLAGQVGASDEVAALQEQMENLSGEMVALVARTTTMGGDFEGLTTRMAVMGEGLEETQVRLEVLTGELMQLWGATEKTVDVAMVTNLGREVEGLAAQLSSARENNLGLSAQVASLLNRVEALSKTAQATTATYRNGANSVSQVGTTGWSGGLTNAGAVVGNSTSGKVATAERAQDTEQKVAEEWTDDWSEIEEEDEGEEGEEMAVPELGDERGQWWWLLPVMLLLAVGVGIWWAVPKLAQKFGR